MKVCFTGLGSIGQRHLKNLSLLLTEQGEALQVHALRGTQKPLEDEILGLLERQVFSESHLDSDYDAVFITNPTALHYDTITRMMPRTRAMFIEKPLFMDTCHSPESLAWKAGGIYYVACPLRYNPVFAWIVDFVNRNRIYCARAICSSYLPNWRKKIDYRQCYSAQRQLGGGVALDLIHEWDYLYALFGAPLELMRIGGTFSELALDSEDLSIYIARYTDLAVEVHLDYFGRTPRRQLELYTKDDVIRADFYANSITSLCKQTQIPLTQTNEDQYLCEMRYFLRLCAGTAHKNQNTPEQAYTVLKYTLGEQI